MNGKGFKTSNLAVAIATTLAVSGAVAPANVSAKASTDAIIGTGKDAIIGTGKDAIIGTGKDAIIGTGKDAIIGTGKDAIIGTGKDAIIGTGKDAIIGTGKDAIIVTGKDAIIGTGRSKSVSSDAIIGTGKDAIIGTGKDAIIGTGKSVVLIMGAIDSVDTATNTISVLGRNLKLPSVAKVQEALAAGRQVMVAVSGRMSTSGTVEQMKLRFIPTDYVAGSSKIVVSGRVSDINASVGTMKVGGVMVDISAAVAAKAPTAGSLVLLVGTQPVRQGLVLAEQLYVK